MCKFIQIKADFVNNFTKNNNLNYGINVDGYILLLKLKLKSLSNLIE